MRARQKTVGAFVLGAIVSAGVLLAIGSGSEQDEKRRFQIVINEEFRVDTFLLDTKEGKIWRPTKYTDVAGEPVVWQYMDRIDTTAELIKWINEN